MNAEYPRRNRLPHEVPGWVAESAVFFITVNCRKRGEATLLEQNRATQLGENACKLMKKSQWWVRLFLVMPDHVHLLASFARAPGMKAVIRNWKRWTALEQGIQWQRDFFDHRIRNAAEYEEKAFYIRQNPGRKGLVARAEDWPYVWEMAEVGTSL